VVRRKGRSDEQAGGAQQGILSLAVKDGAAPTRL
jgi:hypothetical protein